MANYIDRGALIEWLKRIRIIDLSDGRGICRVIMEYDFKKAIKEMPKGIIADVAPVTRCKDCKHYDMGVCLKIYSDGNAHPEAWQSRKPEDFCSYGERKNDEHEH